MLFSLRFSTVAVISALIRRLCNIKYLNSFYYFVYNYKQTKRFGEYKQGKQIRADYTYFRKSYDHELKLCDEKIKFNPS